MVGCGGSGLARDADTKRNKKRPEFISELAPMVRTEDQGQGRKVGLVQQKQLFRVEEFENNM